MKNQPSKYPAITDPIPDTIRLLRDKESEAQLLKVLDRRLESYKNFFSKSLNLLQNFKSKVQEESKRISDDIAEQHAALMRVRNKYDSEMRNQINAKAYNQLLTAVDMYWNRKSQEIKSPSSSVVFKDPHARLLWLESQGVDVDAAALQQAREASQHLRTLRNYKDNLEYAMSDVIDLPLKALACKAARIEALQNAAGLNCSNVASASIRWKRNSCAFNKGIVQNNGKNGIAHRSDFDFIKSRCPT